MGIFGVIFLILIGIVANSSEDSLLHIQQQMFLMNCPLPIYNGVAILNSIDGYVLNYTVTKSNAIQSDFNGTRIDCYIDPLSADPQIGASASIVQYGASTFWGTIPYGWLGFVSDSFQTLFERIQAMFTLIGFFVTPTNFNVLGYTIDDLTGIPLLVVIAIYGISYIFIGIMLYKVISPFSGVG